MGATEIESRTFTQDDIEVTLIVCDFHTKDTGTT